MPHFVNGVIDQQHYKALAGADVSDGEFSVRSSDEIRLTLLTVIRWLFGSSMVTSWLSSDILCWSLELCHFFGKCRPLDGQLLTDLNWRVNISFSCPSSDLSLFWMAVGEWAAIQNGCSRCFRISCSRPVRPYRYQMYGKPYSHPKVPTVLLHSSSVIVGTEQFNVIRCSPEHNDILSEWSYCVCQKFDVRREPSDVNWIMFMKPNQSVIHFSGFWCHLRWVVSVLTWMCFCAHISATSNEILNHYFTRICDSVRSVIGNLIDIGHLMNCHIFFIMVTVF